MISQKLRIALKLNPMPEYRIAQKAGLNPTVLSKLVNGIVPIKKDDARIIKVGKVLGIPAEQCFQQDASK